MSLTNATLPAPPAAPTTTDVARPGTDIPSNTSGSREWLKAIARSVAMLLAGPWLIVFWLKAPLLGRDAALEGSSESLSRVPGLLGRYLRRAFLGCVLAECHPTASIGFGVLFSKAGARIGANVYIGPRCHIGLVTFDCDALVAAGSHITSGAETHGFDDLSRPIREQKRTPKMVHIGAGAWIGSGAIVMANVGKGTVVGAGSVVTKPLPDLVVAVGVPARVLRSRQQSSSTKKQAEEADKHQPANGHSSDGKDFETP